MTEKDLISQLKKLKAVEPDKNWLMAARSEVLSKTPVFDCAIKTQNLSGFNISAVRTAGDKAAGFFGGYRGDKLNDLNKKRKFSFSTLFNFKQLQPAMAGLAIGAMVLGGGSILTVKAAQNSLPGDSLYGIKRMMEGTQMTITPDSKKAILETKFVGRRVEEMVKINENISDVEQREKIEKLEKEIEKGTKNVLAQEKSVKTAKIVNTQMDKYASVLVEIEADKELAASVEKVSFQALGTLANASEDELKEAGTSKEEVVVLLQDEADKIINDTDSGVDGIDKSEEDMESGDDENVEEIKVETEKIEIDCLECDEDSSEEVCLEETDEAGNIECYIEQAVPTVEDKLEEWDLAGAMKILEEEDGEVKGLEDEGVLEEEIVLDDGEEILDVDLGAEN